MTPLYHITSLDEARAAAGSGSYTPLAFGKDGFVHCSYRPQVVATANRIFAGRADLVLLEIDRARLTCPVVEENLEGGAELFPHVYGPLPMAAVVRVLAFPCEVSGWFAEPAALGAPEVHRAAR